MPEKFEELLTTLAKFGVLERCERIETEGVSITLRAPEGAPTKPIQAKNTRDQLVDTLLQAFPGAALPPSLRGGNGRIE